MPAARSISAVVTLVVAASCTSRQPSSVAPTPPAKTGSAPISAEPEEETEPAEEPEAATGAPPETKAGAERKKKAPCYPTLDQCPIDGCEKPDSPHALFNNVKRRTKAADGSSITFDSAMPITLRTMKALQKKADERVGQGATLSKEQRDSLTAIEVGGRTFGEGVAVRLAGYLAPHEASRPASGVHPGGVESVNCRLDRPEWKDFHISLIGKLGAEECAGVVVEMIPQGRAEHPAWTIDRLRSVEGEKKRVLFVGPLFYDNEHKVRPDCTVLAPQPKRMSLWEVHPIVEFYVCDDGSSCQTSSIQGWRRVD